MRRFGAVNVRAARQPCAKSLPLGVLHLKLLLIGCAASGLRQLFQAIEYLSQYLVIDGLDQVMVESRRARPLPIFIPSPACLSDQHDVTIFRPVANAARHIVATHAR
jgi:hypothetical protein